MIFEAARPNATGRNHVHNVCEWLCSAARKHYGHGFAIRAWFCTVVLRNKGLA